MKVEERVRMNTIHVSRTRRVALWGAVVVASAILLTGCTSSNANDSASAGPGATSEKPASIPPAAIPGEDGVAGAAADLSGGICEYSAGAWNLTGTLKNTQKDAQNYSVRVSVSDKETSSVVNAVVITHELAPGESVTLDKTAIIETASSAGLGCVINVTRKDA